MNIKIKKLHDKAVVPSYGTSGAAGLDITAITKEKIYSKDGNLQFIEYKTGLAFEIPTGYVGLIFPRSSVSNKNMSLANSVGVIDSDYRGEVTFRFRHEGLPGVGEYELGDRIGQLVIMSYPKIELQEVSDLEDTKRGDKGYGSTGDKTPYLSKSGAW